MTSPARAAPLCPSCGKGSRDRLLCGRCTGQLRGALRQVAPALVGAPVLPVDGQGLVVMRVGAVGHRQTLPWEDQAGSWTGLSDQLTSSLARQDRQGGRDGGRSSSAPMPLDATAQRAGYELRATLSEWVLLVTPLGGPFPDDTITALAGWLLDRVREIRLREDAAKAKRDICWAVGMAMQAIDKPPPAEVFIGRCQVCGRGDLYAIPGADVATCRGCDAVAPHAKGLRSALMLRAEDELVVKSQMLKVLPTLYGLQVTDTRFRHWVSRKKIEPRACSIETHLPLFRVGDVLDVANGERARTAVRA